MVRKPTPCSLPSTRIRVGSGSRAVCGISAAASERRPGPRSVNVPHEGCASGGWIPARRTGQEWLVTSGALLEAETDHRDSRRGLVQTASTFFASKDERVEPPAVHEKVKDRVAL